MRRTFGHSQRPMSGLLPIPISLNATLAQPPAIEQPPNPLAPDDPDVQPKAKVPAFSTPKAKVQCSQDKLSEVKERLTVANHKSNLSTSTVLSKETFLSHAQSEVVALTNRPHFSTPLVKQCNPLENSISLPGTDFSSLGDPLGGEMLHLAERNKRDGNQHFR